MHSLLRYIVGSPSSSSSSPNFPNCFSPRELASVYAAYLRYHFSVSQPKTLRSKARGYFSELCRATCPWSLTRLFALLSLPLNFFEAASNLSLSTATGPDKVAYPMLKHLAWIFFFTSSISPGLCIPFLPSGRYLPLFPFTRWESPSTLLLPSGLSFSPPVPQSCLNASFYLVYSFFWNLIPFSLPTRSVSALDGLL